MMVEEVTQRGGGSGRSGLKKKKEEEMRDWREVTLELKE